MHTKGLWTTCLQKQGWNPSDLLTVTSLQAAHVTSLSLNFLIYLINNTHSIRAVVSIQWAHMHTNQPHHDTADTNKYRPPFSVPSVTFFKMYKYVKTIKGSRTVFSVTQELRSVFFTIWFSLPTSKLTFTWELDLWIHLSLSNRVLILCSFLEALFTVGTKQGPTSSTLLTSLLCFHYFTYLLTYDAWTFLLKEKLL